MARKKVSNNKIEVENIRDISGEVNIAAGNIVKNIKTIYQRALTATEEAARGRKIEEKLLAQGVSLFAQNLSAQAGQSTESDNPYKGLLAYNLNEAEIFFGRNEAKQDVLNCIKKDPLTVLHAESGAGKSSLLQAGIAAHLIANGQLAVRLRSYSADPVEFIKRTFLPELSQTPDLGKAPLREFLRQVCAVLGPKVNLYLLLDQFEEFFHLITKKDERKLFLESLADCLNDSSLRVRWVLAIRAEALSDLAELESFGITPFKNTYRLNHLSRNEAQVAITKPAERYGITLEPALIDHILDTLATNNEITPTQLQLVCSALSDDLPEDKILTLDYYTDHEGGTEGILRDYLKRQLEHLPAEEQVPAWKVLRALITADRLRAVKTHDEIVEELKLSGVSRQQIDIILARLMERRLVVIQPAITEIFELAHDYLVKEIELDPQEQARKAAQELLDQETRTFQRYKTLLTAERLAVIEPYKSELRISSEARDLFYESQKTLLASRRRRRALLYGSFTVGIFIVIMGFALVIDSQRRYAAEKFAHFLRLEGQAINLPGNQLDLALLLSLEAKRLNDSAEGNIVLFKLLESNPRLTTYLQRHEDLVLSVVFTGDGKKLVSGSADGTIVSWDVASQQKISQTRVSQTKSKINCMAFSRDAQLIALGYADGTVTLAQVGNGKQLFSLHGHTNQIWSLAFSPDGLALVSGSEDNTIILWNVATGKPIGHPLKGHGALVKSLAFSPDGAILASGDDGGTILLWDVASLTQLPDPLLGHLMWVTTLSFSPDGKTLASGSGDSTIILWNVSTHQRIDQLTGHSHWVTSLAFSPDGETLASGSQDRSIIIWDLATHQPRGFPLIGHNDEVLSLVFSPNGSKLASSSRDNTVILWDIERNARLSETLVQHTINMRSLAFSPDGKIMAASNNIDGNIILWNMMAHEPVDTPLRGHNSGVRCMTFSPDGKILASGSDDSTIILWDVASHRQLARLIGHQGSVMSVAFNPDGKTLASGSADSSIILWDIHTGQQIRKLTGHTGLVMSVAFSPDGQTLASGGWDKTVRLWDVATGQGEKLKQANLDLVSSVAFDRSGQMLASGGFPGVVYIWNVEKKQPIGGPLGGQVADIDSITLNPADDKILALVSPNDTVLLWDIATRELLADLRTAGTGRDNTGRYNVAFSPNGKTLVWGSCETIDAYHRCTQGKIILSDIDADSWQTRACHIAGRNLTNEEWLQYFPNEQYRTTCKTLPIHPSVFTSIVLQALSDTNNPNRVQRAIDNVNYILKEYPNSDNLGRQANQIVKDVTEVQVSKITRADLKNGNIESALALLEDTRVVGLEINDFNQLNLICWYGSLWGYATQVLPYCEQAVNLAQDDANIRDSRGLARALTGNFSGAIEDFQFFVENSVQRDEVQQRQQWIDDLKTGKSPFIREVLEQLKSQ